jgi:hypothetical protein
LMVRSTIHKTSGKPSISTSTIMSIIISIIHNKIQYPLIHWLNLCLENVLYQSHMDFRSYIVVIYYVCIICLIKIIIGLSSLIYTDNEYSMIILHYSDNPMIKRYCIYLSSI